MSFEHYQFSANGNFLDYAFESTGPKGGIKKVVRFSPKNIKGETYFNLGFGDFDEATGKVNDFSVSDNQDRDKILATVAATVLLFLEEYPDMTVYAKGSTDARTRLYQMSIAANHKIIETNLEIRGFVNGNWQVFESNVNYEAFVAKRRKY